jgi:hypothetical protein
MPSKWIANVIGYIGVFRAAIIDRLAVKALLSVVQFSAVDGPKEQPLSQGRLVVDPRSGSEFNLVSAFGVDNPVDAFSRVGWKASQCAFVVKNKTCISAGVINCYLYEAASDHGR